MKRRILRSGFSPDVNRLAAAVSRPGIDPRVWVSLAIVTEVQVTEDGAFANVYCLPSGDAYTARVGCVYAGGGFGMWFPLRVDDEVEVTAPSGDPTEGLIVTNRLWSKADPPPQGAVDHPDDVLLYAADGSAVTLSAGKALALEARDGKATIDASDDVVVQGGDKPIARKGDSTGNGTISMLAVASTGATAITFQWIPEGGGAPSTIGTIALTTAGGTAVAGTAALTGEITSGADKFKG